MNKILFNGLQFSRNGAGISTYTYNLLKYFNENHDDLDCLIRSEEANNFYNKNLMQVTNIKNSKSRIFKEQISLIRKLNKYSVIHYPDYSIPILSNSSSIATIHDLAFFTVKDCYTRKQVLVKKFLMKQTVRKAKKLICISKFTYKELKRHFPDVNDDKVSIIYNGFNEPTINISREIDLFKFNITKPYLLFIGTISPSKNLLNLIKAFKEVIKIKNNVQLVIVGKKGWKCQEVFEIIDKEGLDNSIIFTGYVLSDELEHLYKNSRFVIYPSLYEGFGLPTLEAMARDKAVLLSNIEVFKEIAEDAAIYCDPYSIDDIAKKIILMLTNDDLLSKCIEKGKKRIKLFSWEKCANETYGIYNKVLTE